MHMVRARHNFAHRAAYPAIDIHAHAKKSTTQMLPETQHHYARCLPVVDDCSVVAAAACTKTSAKLDRCKQDTPLRPHTSKAAGLMQEFYNLSTLRDIMAWIAGTRTIKARGQQGAMKSPVRFIGP